MPRPSSPLRLQLRPLERWLWSALNVLPPGLGAIVVGTRNPHTRLRRNGILQLVLFVAGAWPLIVPGALALLWAIRDAVRIAQAEIAPLPPKEPTGAPRET